MKPNYLKRRPSFFEKIADIAAINFYRGKYIWQRPNELPDEEILARVKCPPSRSIHPSTFRKPTSHPRGYFAVLDTIAHNPEGISRRLLSCYFDCQLTFQLENLEYAKLITLGRDPNSKYFHRFRVTDLGKAYIAAVESEFNF